MSKPRAKGVPWLRITINVFDDRSVIIGDCGAAWVWALIQMKKRRKRDGAIEDDDLHPNLMARDMGVAVEVAQQQLDALKASPRLLERGEDGLWRTPNWHVYQPDQRVGKNARGCQDMTPMSRSGAKSRSIQSDPGESKAIQDQAPPAGADPVQDRIAPHSDPPDPHPDDRRLTVDKETKDRPHPGGEGAVHSKSGEGSALSGLGNGWQQEGAAVGPEPSGVRMVETEFGPRPADAAPLQSSAVPIEATPLEQLVAEWSGANPGGPAPRDYDDIGSALTRLGTVERVREAMRRVGAKLGHRARAHHVDQEARAMVREQVQADKAKRKSVTSDQTYTKADNDAWDHVPASTGFPTKTMSES